MRRARLSILIACAGCMPEPPGDLDLVGLAPPADGLQLATGPLAVPAGSEVLACRVVETSLREVTCVGRIEVATTAGVARVSLQRGGCPPIEGPALFDAEPPFRWILPADAAFRLAPGDPLALSVDVVNAVSNSLVAVSVNLERVDCEGTDAVEPLALATEGDRSCTFPVDSRVVAAVAGGSLAVRGEDPFYEGDAFDVDLDLGVPADSTIEWTPPHEVEPDDFRFGPSSGTDRPPVVHVAPTLAGIVCG